MTNTMFILPQMPLTKAEHQIQQHQIKSASKRPLEEIIWPTPLSGLTNKGVLILHDLSPTCS